MSTPSTEAAPSTLQPGLAVDDGDPAEAPAGPRGFSSAEVAFLIGVPLAWAVLLLFHPTGDGEDLYPVVSDEVTAWVVVHVGTLLFVPMIAAAVWLLLRGVEGAAAQVSRVALVPFVLFYVTFEVLVGIGVGLLSDEVNGLPAAEQPASANVIEEFADSGLIAVFETIGRRLLARRPDRGRDRPVAPGGRSAGGSDSPRAGGGPDGISRASVRTGWSGAVHRGRAPGRACASGAGDPGLAPARLHAPAARHGERPLAKGSVVALREDGRVGSPPELQVVRAPEGEARWVRIRIWLAGAMWFPVLGANLVAVVLGISLPSLDGVLDDQPSLPISLSAVEQVLGALAAGMITFTGVVFSAVLVAAQIQSTSYSPRLAARLRRDPVVVAALALPTATASYAMFALAAIGRQADSSGDDVASTLTVGVALLLAFVTFGGFIALVQRAFDSTQIGGIFRAIVRRTHHVIREGHPVGAGTAELPPRPRPARDHHRGHALRGARGARIRGPGGAGAPGARKQRLRRGRADGRPVHHAGHRRPPASRTRSGASGRSGSARPGAGQATHHRPGPRLRPPHARGHSDPGPLAGRQRPHHRRAGARPHREPPRRAPPPPAWAGDRGRFRGEARGLFQMPTWAEYLDLGLIEIRRYGGVSIQVARRLRALYAHLLEIAGEDARPRIELERRLLDEAIADAFPDAAEREIAGRPDRLGLGSAV